MSQLPPQKNDLSLSSSRQESNSSAFAVSPPSVQLPNGGGAIRGMGKKFADNPVIGTDSMTTPIATSLGRAAVHMSGLAIWAGIFITPFLAGR